MSGDNTAAKAEIVIVRRRMAEDAGGGKGGAWKIAYADFVTAMMAFFLVMWLINASNEETRSQVASYFNPIKLTDTSTGARSIRDMKDTRNPQNATRGDSSEGTQPAKKDVQEESALLANPPKSLDKVAKTVSEADDRNAGQDNRIEIAPSLKPDSANPGVGDPFDPRAWEKPAPGAPAGGEAAAASAGKPGKPEQPPETMAAPPRGGDEAARAAQPASEATRMAQAAALSADIAERLGSDGEELRKAVDVKPDGTGMLINLTERSSFEMFRTGSAEPEPQLLRLMEAIAASLSSRQGGVVIRGHTDSRPYRNKYYDNWQLSTARAHLARYMLLRGGLADSRILRVEGVADREPLKPQDPQAPENRRIEIFLAGEAP